MNERGDVITLLDEDGKTHEFSLVDVVEVEERRYAILQPSDGTDPALVFRVDGDTLVAVEDETEFRKVAEAIEDTAEYDDVEIVDDEATSGEDLDDDTHKEDGGGPVM